MSTEYVNAWNAAHADSGMITRDLDTSPVPHLDFESISAGFVPEADRSETMAGKKVTFVVAQGSSYVDGTPKAGWDYATAMGAADVEVITVEFGLAGVVPALEGFTTHKEASTTAAKEAA